MTPAAHERAWAAALFTLAGLYFSLSMWRGLEWAEEGQIIYPSWRVARGALPYRDFYHLYGPALFLLNGALFRLFGADLLVTRVSLVILKALVAVLVYLAARRVAARPFALLASALAIVVWGTGGWVFTTPYANHYALGLVLFGLLVFLRTRGRFRLACALTGACFAVAALFKQTSGVFAVLAFGLFLVWDRTADVVAGFPGGDRAARLVRAIFLAVVLSLAVVYLSPVNTPWTAAMLLSPVAVSIALLARREMRGGAGAPQRGAWGLIAAGFGFMVPVAGCAAVFAAHGALGALVFNTLTGGPKLMRWFDPLAVPPGRVVGLALLVLIGYAALYAARAGGSAAARRGAALVGVACAAAAAVIIAGLARRPGWQWTLMWGVPVLPFAVVWGTLPAVFPEIATWLPRPLRPRAAARPALALFFFAAVTGLLCFYPAGDFVHLLMSVPLFLPLLAAGAACAYRGPAAPPRAWLAVAASTAVTVLLCAPFVSLLRVGTRMPVSAAGFARASGISGSGAQIEDAAELVHYLDTLPARPLLVLVNEPLVYFLSGRDSVLAREEYLLYLVGFDLIREADAHAYVPEPMIIERLNAVRPTIVDAADGTTRFARMFPDVARYVAAHYRPVRVIGRYGVLEWVG